MTLHHGQPVEVTTRCDDGMVTRELIAVHWSQVPAEWLELCPEWRGSWTAVTRESFLEMFGWCPESDDEQA
jgi:hypothetical protein